VTQILEFMGVNRIITVDLHCLQAQGFVSNKVVFDDYEGAFAGLSYFLDSSVIPNKDEVCVVSPDAGGMKRAKAFHGHFGYHGYDQVGLAMISKERKQANQVDSMTLIGDVKGKTCIIVDDMIDTAGTLVTAAKLLKDSGASRVFAFATHGIFSGPAAERIAKSDLEKVIVTDSMTVTPEFKAVAGDKFKQISLDLLLAEVIRRTHQREDTQDLLKIPVY
jgi:ribose-phosphate pyrophosphokinase